MYGTSAIHHSRIRLGLSALNGQRAHYHLIPDPSCLCGAPCENSMHYFLECPHHNAIRRILLQDMGRLYGSATSAIGNRSRQ